MKNNKAILRKIPLHSFIEQLVNLYEMGVDYVDLVGDNDKEQNFIEMHFTNDYMCQGAREEEGPLSDEDLNQII